MGNPANLEVSTKIQKKSRKNHEFKKNSRKNSNYCWKHKTSILKLKKTFKKFGSPKSSNFHKKHLKNVWISRKFKLLKKLILQANICRMWMKPEVKFRVFRPVVVRRVPISLNFNKVFSNQEISLNFKKSSPKNSNYCIRNFVFRSKYMIEYLSD